MNRTSREETEYDGGHVLQSFALHASLVMPGGVPRIGPPKNPLLVAPSAQQNLCNS